MERFDTVIVGSGHGGAQAALALRQAGYTGSVAILGRDRNPPYERPPLSKDYLAGARPFERILIRPEGFWNDKGVTLRPGSAVSAVDAAAQTVTLADGSPMGWDRLIWSAGGDARRLSCPGADLAGIHTIRHRSDVDTLRAELDAGARRVVVAGAGYIGLEAAAVLRKAGCEVTVIERMDRVLARVAGPEISAFYAAEHRANGVDLRLDTGVERVEGDNGRIAGVVTDTGETVPCDILIVGIGIVPSVAPLIAAGAAGSNGVDVDEYCRTTLDNVYAIGDCAAHANPYAAGDVVRVESVQNANDMATTVARHITGTAEPYDAVPWFWSNQYDLRLQTVGLSGGHDARVLRGDPASRKFAVVYMREGRVIALDCVNATRDYAQGRKLVESRAVIDPAVLADADTPLKDLV